MEEIDFFASFGFNVLVNREPMFRMFVFGLAAPLT